MVELYNIHHRIGRAVPTGKVETGRNGRTRYVTKFVEFYETDNGSYTPEEWKNIMERTVVEDKEEDVLKMIEEHCKRNCAWLHSAPEIREYALEILAGRTFLCGNDNWKDITDKVKDSYFKFEF